MRYFTTLYHRCLGVFPLWIRLILLSGLLLRLWLCAQPFDAIDDTFFPDDTYISLGIAQNLAVGKGALCGTTISNGYQPLYVWLMVPVYALCSSLPPQSEVPIRIAIIVLSLCNMAALVVFLHYLRRFVHSTLALGIGAALWVVLPSSLDNALNGLESSLALLCCLLCMWWYSQRILSATAQPTFTSFLTQGIFIGIAMLSRMDAGVMALVLALHYGWHLYRLPNRQQLLLLPLYLRTMGVTAATAFVVVLPWWIYSYLTTDLIMQVSGNAVHFMAGIAQDSSLSAAVVGLKRAVKWLALSSFPLLALIVSATLITLRRGIRAQDVLFSLRPLAPLLLSAIAYFLVYALYFYASWFFHRYLFLCIVALLALTIMLIDTALQSAPTQEHNAATDIARSTRSMLLIIGCFIALGLMYAQGSMQDIYMPKDRNTRGYKDLALWAEQHFAAGTHIGSSQIGALAYFAPSLRVTNLDGVVNAECYDSLVAKRCMNYIRAQGIEYVAGTSVNINFVRLTTQEWNEHYWQYLYTIPDIYTWESPWEVYKVQY